MVTMNFLIGLIIGLAIGMHFWLQEREYRKMIERHREDVIKDQKFWEKMYKKYRTAYEKLTEPKKAKS